MHGETVTFAVFSLDF